MAMAIFATEAKRVTDDMLPIAAKAIAEQVSQDTLAAGRIYPRRERIYRISLHVAARVATRIFDQGLAGVSRPDDVGAPIRSPAYRPVYPE